MNLLRYKTSDVPVCTSSAIKRIPCLELTKNKREKSNAYINFSKKNDAILIHIVGTTYLSQIFLRPDMNPGGEGM